MKMIEITNAQTLDVMRIPAVDLDRFEASGWRPVEHNMNTTSDDDAEMETE